MPAFIDLSNQKFERLTVLKYIKEHNSNTGKWLCKCDCGLERFVRSYSLISGKTKSCGCYKKDQTIKRNTRHGFKLRNGVRLPEYSVWESMNGRCNSAIDKNYKVYKSKGISVCERWRGENGFMNFYKDMGVRPTVNHSIDRINSNLGYSAENCRWATAKEQARNTSRNRFIEFNGKSACISEWAELTGLLQSTIIRRLSAGWSIDKALTKKSQRFRSIK